MLEPSAALVAMTKVAMYICNCAGQFNVDTKCHSFCSCCQPDFIIIGLSSVLNNLQDSRLDDVLAAFWDCTCAMCMVRSPRALLICCQWISEKDV